MISFFSGSTWSFLDALVTITTVLFVIYNWWINKKQLQKIDVYIQKGDDPKVRIPTYMIRKNFTRSELFGILGALDKERDFKIAYLKSEAFLQNVLEIQQGREDEMIIRLQDGDKFDWSGNEIC